MNINISKTMLTKLLADGHLTLDAVTGISLESKELWRHALLESLYDDRSKNTANKSNGPSDRGSVS